jgi:nitroreductase
MKIIDVIRRRRSIRKFKKKEVRAEAIKVVLDAGRWAPTAGNRQPLRFLVLSNEEEREIAARLYVEAYKKEAEDLLNREDADKYYKNPFEVKKKILNMLDLLEKQLKDPPFIILICADTRISRSYIFEAGLAAQNIMLSAWELNLGSCCIEIATTLLSEYFDKKTLKRVYNIPDEVEVVAMIPIGRIEEMPQNPDREMLKEYTYTGYWIGD